MYPHLRRKFLSMSHKNLLGIYKKEQEYFINIAKVNKGETVIFSDSDSDGEPPKFKGYVKELDDTEHPSHPTNKENVLLSPISEEELIKANL